MKIKGYRIDAVLAERRELTLAKATQLSLDRPVFLKILKELESDPIILQRFEQEARLLARLNHPNIITVYELQLSGKQPMLVLEFFEGLDLDAFLEQHQPITALELLSIAKHILTGCSQAHLSGVLHRDLKPANLLINSSGLVKIADFGLAGLLGSRNLPLVGSPGYMAPELALGEQATELTDIYALGMTLYTLAAGRNPLKGNGLSESINMAIQKNPHPLVEVRPDLPRPFVQLIERMIHKTPHERIQSCDRCLELLNQVNIEETLQNPGSQTIQETLSKPEILGERQSSRTWIIGSALIGVLLAVAFMLSTIWDDKEVTGNFHSSLSNPDSTMANQDISPLPSLDSVPKPTVQKVVGDPELTVSEPAPSPNLLNSSVSAMLKRGSLKLTAIPWAEIRIDDQNIGVTPLQAPVDLEPGNHTVHFMHPNYPEVIRTIRIEPGKDDSLGLNWSKALGFLELTVYPWAEVYINSKVRDMTPLQRPIPLQPGEFQLFLKNPNFPPWNQFLSVSAGDTLRVNVRLRKPDGT